MATVGEVLRQDNGAVRVLTLHRPAVRNAFNDAMYQAMVAELSNAAEDRTVRVVVLTGAGGVFSAGHDLRELNEASDRRGLTKFIDTLAAFPKPLVAGVNGAAVGIGLVVLLYCDVVLMSRDARLRAPFAALGLSPEAGASWLLPRVVGLQTAAHLLMSAGWMDAADARERGLAWTLSEPDELDRDTIEAAQAMAAMPLESLVAIKHLLRVARTRGFAATREQERRIFDRLQRGRAHSLALAAVADRGMAAINNG